MRVELDTNGVSELERRFGDLHDSVIRRFSGAFAPSSRVELEIEALALDGTWWRLVLALEGVTELRLAEGVAIWGNEPTTTVFTHAADGAVTREVRTRDFGSFSLGAPTNQVIFGAAIHAVPEGVFVDLSPADPADPGAERELATWRRSTFYVLGKRGEARIGPLEEAARSLGVAYLRHGATTMFHRRELFEAAISQLTAAGYRVHLIDASTDDAFRACLTKALRFLEHFGYEPWTGNLDALNDAFHSIDYAVVPGVVLAFERFDRLHADDPRTAGHVLDILESASRDALVDGHHLVGLVQSNEPALAPGEAGGRAPSWNSEEWLAARRGL